MVFGCSVSFSLMKNCFSTTCLFSIGLYIRERIEKYTFMIKMVDRPNTTPIGQGGASQWRNVLFDPHLFEARLRNFVFLWRHFSGFLGTRWIICSVELF